MHSMTVPLTKPKDTKGLVVAALGVVFGDLGTSPLYTMRQCFLAGTAALEPTPTNVLGILSLIFWAILIVISLKYVVFIMRADNRGEGGIMALMSLIVQKASIDDRLRGFCLALGLVGASLFYGDGMITPAISVLSAIEGLEVLTPRLHAFIIPTTLGVLILLFAVQRRGTARVGSLFGPIMVVWFLSITVLGVLHLAENPGVVAAVNPMHAVHFMFAHGWYAFFALGAVVLAVTGAEALYADMGHFGRGPIRKAWFFLVLPALLLNYAGQGALLLQNPSAVESPFYLLVPEGWLAFMIVLATLATIIASQAVISGAFSLASQAIQLGYCPRLNIQYSSEEERGQIYIPWVNWTLMIAIIGLVLGFRSSSNLAAAYGIAVTGTMLIDTVLAFVVVCALWKWNFVGSLLLASVFLLVDLSFFTATATKILAGGWFPLLVGAGVFTLLITWKQGRAILSDRLQSTATPINDFLAEIEQHPPTRVPGTAVFLTSGRGGIPYALQHNLKHNKVLHETVVFLTVFTETVPRVAAEKRHEVANLGQGFYRVNLRYGFMENPNVPKVLKFCSRDFDIDLAATTFFVSRETLLPASTTKMPRWRLRLFIGMSRNMSSVVSFFKIPPDRVVEIGVQVAL